MHGATMAAPRVVWIDFCCTPQRHDSLRVVEPRCDVRRIGRVEDIRDAVTAHRPHFACVEYDYPDRGGLRAVPLLRREFPALPVLMLTEYHSEALAIWAFRSRVWDYRVKPVATETLLRVVAGAARAGRTLQTCGWSIDPMPPDLVAPAGHLRRPLVAAPLTTPAVAWISEHFAEPIRVAEVARLCRLSASEFSRTFHREQGVPFRRFLLQYRIARARDYLAEPGASVSQVAYAVGFNDLSQFGRMFRRVAGMPASHYRRRLPGST